MIDLIAFLLALLSILGPAYVAVNHQTATLLDRCPTCTACASIDGYWPWVQADLRELIQPGEAMKLYPFFTGPIVCAASRGRLDDLQRQIDERTRLHLQDPDGR